MRRKRKRNDDGADSQLDADGAQGVLFCMPAHPVESEAVALRRCTAGLLFERDRDSYDAVVRLLAENVPIRKIKRDFGLGTDTVLAIKRREAQNVGTLKLSIADTLLQAASLGAEKVVELIADCDDPVAAAMATKMCAETSNLMRGQATSIQEHRVIVVDANAAADRLKKMALEMGLGSGEKLGLGERSEAGLERVGMAGLPVALDVLSNGYVTLCAADKGVMNVRHTLGHTLKDGTPTLPLSGEQGGGGGADGGAGLSL